MFQAVILVFAAFHLAIGAPVDQPVPSLSPETAGIVKLTQNITQDLVALHGDYLALADVNAAHEVPQNTIADFVIRIKKEKHEIHSLKVHINAYLGILASYEIRERSVLEFSRISLERYEKVLDKIAMNILGLKSGITKIERERVSDELNTAIALEYGKFDTLSKDIATIDAELQIVRSDSSDAKRNEAEKIALEKLKDVVQRTEAIRSQLSQAYLLDLETSVVEGLELNMIQQAEFDTLVTVLVWFENYCRNYQELMRKILDDKF